MARAAAIMTRAAKSGPTAIGAAALGGYVVRLAVILVALVVLRHQPWIDLPTLGFDDQEALHRLFAPGYDDGL